MKKDIWIIFTTINSGNNVCNQYSISQSDEELWSKLKQGHRKSLRALFLRYYDSLFAYGLTVCSKEALIEDCLQELFFQLWDRHQELSAVQNVKGYLWIAFRHRLMNQLKKKDDTNRNLTPFKNGMKKVESIEGTMIEDEQEAQKRRALNKVIHSLSQREREVLFLKYYEGMSYSEIKNILGIKYQTARNYVYRAIERLKDALEDEGIKVMLSLLLMLRII